MSRAIAIKVPPLRRRDGPQNVPMDRAIGAYSPEMERTLHHMVPVLRKDGGTPLLTCNVTVNNRWTNHRTSMRLDVTSWLLLDHIATAEGYANRDVLISAVRERFPADDLPLTALVRLFLQTYTAPDAVLDLLARDRRACGTSGGGSRARS